MVDRGPASPAAANEICSLHLMSDRRLTLAALALIALPACWFVRADLAAISGGSQLFSLHAAVRVLVVAIPVAAMLFLMISPGLARPAFARTVFWTSSAIAVCYLFTSIETTQEPAMRGSLFVIAVMYTALPNTFWRQVMPPAALSVGLLAFGGLPFSQYGHDLAGNVIVFVVFNAFGILVVKRRLRLERDVQVAWLNQRAARREAEEAMAELRILRGIIPICAHCKRVRTEVGGWQQIEQYVTEHSSADFSHGICPSCITVHYGETGS